jgi:hypothetical protein
VTRGGRGACSACAHPELAQIDIDLAGGASLRSVAARTGISRASLSRHHRNHRNQALASIAQVEVVAASGGRSAVSRVESILSRTEAILGAAEEAGNGAQALAAIAQLRPTVELLARLQGELNAAPAVVINLETSPDWLEMRTRMLRILASHPEALREVADALRPKALPAA